ncbi:MAG: histidinol-phosphate transaminase [Anaerolineales bacterium]|nr:histidinol-phosphate transaminase [Anaerolineales bacterium]
MFDATDLIRRHVSTIESYQPIQPFDVLSQRLGQPSDAIIKLDANENPYGPVTAVLEALACLPYPHIYPDPESIALRQALQAYTGLPSENILVGAGADELIDLIMRLFLEPGDAVLNCPPTFGMYAFDANVNAARVVNVPRFQDFSLTLQALEQAVEKYHPKLLFLSSPNNPDGSLIPPEVLDHILALPLIVVLDEAYVEFADQGSSRLQEAPERSNLIVLRTFSKWAGLAGLRVGYGAFPSSLMPHLWKIKQPYNVSVAATAAALASLQHVTVLKENCYRIVAERQRLYNGLQAVPYLQPYPSQANFILCSVVGRDANELKTTLAQSGIFVRYFNKPGLRDHIRISVGKPEHSDALLVALAELE